MAALTIRAGARARARLERAGLDPGAVEIVPGAAGGAKGLGIAALDRAIFADWLPSAPRVRHLIGASIGAWRFAAACCPDPKATLAAADGASIRFDAFHTRMVGLDAENLDGALLASASIPLVLEGVADIPRAPPGIYWDGGIVDYHLHLPYHHAEGLVLYPHFTDHIVPGWLDKTMPWRRARGAWLDNVILVAPSREYLAALPHGKLPDRRDFVRFAGDDAGRMRYWRHAIAQSERLADAFLEFVRRPDPAAVLPL